MLVSSPNGGGSAAKPLLLVTYDAMPDLSPDDRLLLRALLDLGFPARAAVWDDPKIDWESARAAVLRSTWDYFHKPSLFRNWIVQTGAQTQLINPPELLLWNIHKSYLDELGKVGVPTVPTFTLKICDGHSGLDIGLSAGWKKIVIKPAVSGSAHNTKVFDLDSNGDAAGMRQHVEKIHCTTDAMIQLFIPTVFTDGERSLVYLGGSYSHAFRKAAFSAGAAGGEAKETSLLPSDEELGFCSEILAKLPVQPAYARVDIIPHDGGLLLMELELIEPALQFRLCPGSAQRFARSLIDTAGIW